MIPNPQNKKKKPKPKPQAEPSSLPEPGKPVSSGEEATGSTGKGGMNGFHVNGCVHDTESVDSLSEGLDALSIDARELEECECPAGPPRAGQCPGSTAGTFWSQAESWADSAS